MIITQSAAGTVTVAGQTYACSEIVVIYEQETTAPDPIDITQAIAEIGFAYDDKPDPPRERHFDGFPDVRRPRPILISNPLIRWIARRFGRQ